MEAMKPDEDFEDRVRQPEGFEVTEHPSPVTLHVPETVGTGDNRRFGRWIPVPFKGRKSSEHPEYVLYEEHIGEGEDQKPAKFFMRIGSRLNKDKLVPDIIKGEAGKKTLKYMGAIAAAIALEETARRTTRAIRKRG